jgi:hypothetical protein
MFIFAPDQELCACNLMGYIMGYDYSLDQKDIFKFIYCFMIIFFIVYIFKYFLLLIPCNHKVSAIILLF